MSGLISGIRIQAKLFTVIAQRFADTKELGLFAVDRGNDINAAADLRDNWLPARFGLIFLKISAAMGRREAATVGLVRDRQQIARSTTDVMAQLSDVEALHMSMAARGGQTTHTRAYWTQLRRFWVILGLALPLPAFAAELKIVTWNLDWLTTRQAGHGLPADMAPRSEEDFARLARYAQELNADVVAIQEVDGFAAATKIFPRELYSIHMTHDHVMQRVGIAIRRELKYDMNPDVTALAMNHLRSGADITLHLESADLRILAVHLKTGCRNQKLARTHDRSCLELRDQVPVLTEWIAARRQEGTPFIILGDFNPSSRCVSTRMRSA